MGKVKLPTFLQQQLKPQKGNIIEIPAQSPVFQEKVLANEYGTPQRAWTSPYHYQETDGEIVGIHEGAHFYTIGQRKGLNVGGKAEPLFVIETDTTTNTVYVGMSENHPGLNRRGLFIPEEDVHWIREDMRLNIGESKKYSVRIRYRQALEKATLFRESDGIMIIFENLQRGITPGQFAAWYEEEELIGSGVIS